MIIINENEKIMLHLIYYPNCSRTGAQCLKQKKSKFIPVVKTKDLIYKNEMHIIQKIGDGYCLYR